MSMPHLKVRRPLAFVAALIAVAATGLVARRLAPAGSDAAEALARVQAGESPDSIVIAASAYRECGRVPVKERARCYERIFFDVTATRGVRLAMRSLNRLGTLDSSVLVGGHEIAHAIGNFAGGQAGDPAVAFASCTEAFESGCYHGVLQKYLEGVRQLDPGTLSALCQPYMSPKASRWVLFQCLHGLGHGLLRYHGFELPPALASCDLLAQKFYRESCYGGVFMENIARGLAVPPATDAAHASHTAATASSAGAQTAGHEHMHGTASGGGPAFKSLDRDDPLYPCSAVAEKYVPACYDLQTTVILNFAKGDVAAAAKVCDRAPALMSYRCYESLGRDISSVARQNSVEGVRLCALGTPRYQPWCYAGIARNFVNVNGKPDEGFAFCRAVSGDANAMKCYEAVGSMVRYLSPSDRRRETMCTAAGDRRYVEACRYGAQLNDRPPRGLPLDGGGAASGVSG
jgi:hypothetical protein